jgi:hypothetical protein
MTPPNHLEKAGLVLILTGLLAALVWQAWRTGVIIDEPSHLLSAYLYWRGADNLKPGDMPSLIKIVGGWVPRLIGLPVPYDNAVWSTGHEWPISGEMMHHLNGPQTRKVFFLSRLPLLAFPLLTALLLWRWGRELFGGRTALLITLAFALEPTALAHGALFKNDLAATFGYLLFWYRAWLYWKDPTPRGAAWLGGALLVAVLSKMSMLVLAGIAPALVLLRHATLGRRSPRAAAGALALVLLIPYVGSLAACQFDTRRLPRAELAAYAQDPMLPRSFVAAAQVFRVLPVPRPMWNGTVSLFHSDGAGNPVYLLGKQYLHGHPLYFVIALAVKVPVPLQALLVGGAILLAVRWRRGSFHLPDLFWLAPPFFYIGLASLSSVQLGVRLVLPALPFGLLLCGAAISAWRRGPGLALVAGLYALLAVESARIYPHGISYFNLWSGGPENGLRVLADSNLDWGQDLPELAAYVRKHQIRRFSLSYFGNDNPYRFFREDEMESLTPPWEPQYAKGTVYEPAPGLYAISANLLPGHFFNKEYRDYYRRFRERKPIGRAGYSIYIYQIE